MKEEIYKIYRKNFPFINREEKTARDIINNPNNIIFEKRNSNDELIGCSIVNKNTILLLVVNKEYRNIGIGTELLKKSENCILNNGYYNIVLGAGFDYLMPGVPTSEKVTESVHENLFSGVNDNASNFFKKRGYYHSWDNINCFDMYMPLSKFISNKKAIGDTINGITYRWATIDDLKGIIECADDACKYQDEKFSKYYKNNNLYKEDNNQKVLVAVKEGKIVGTLIVSIETEGKDIGSVGCTCVMFKEAHKKIGTNMVNLGTKYLKDLGLKNANLGYTYTGLDKMYGASGYEIYTYYLMGEKKINNKQKN